METHAGLGTGPVPEEPLQQTQHRQLHLSLPRPGFFVLSIADSMRKANFSYFDY